MGQQRGSMTVFFCLVLVMVSALICTCLESARTAGLRFMAKAASDSALQSVFADYHGRLWEDYHVFFHHEEDGDLTDTMKEYLSYYENPGKGLYLQDEYTDMWELSVDGVVIAEAKTAISDGGRLFLEQAVEFEKYQIAESLLESLLDRVDLLDEINRVRTFAVRVSDAFELVQKAGSIYQDVRDSVKTVTALAQQVKALLLMEESDPEVVCQGLKNLGEQVSWLIQLGKDYLERAEKMGELTGELSKEFGDSEETVYGQQIKQLKAFALEGVFGSAVSTVIAEAETFSGQLYGLIGELEVILSEEENKETEREPSKTDEAADDESGGDDEETASDESETEPEAEPSRAERLAELLGRIAGTVESGAAMMESLTSCLNQADQESSEEGGESGGEESGRPEASPEAGEEGQSLFDMVKQWKNMAVLSLVMGEEGVQTREDRLTEPAQLPSSVVSGDLSDVSLAEKGLFVFYIADSFSDGLSGDQGSFAYQQEYILFGKGDSRSNLTAMAERLLAVREGLNLAYLLTNTRMRLAAETAAYALVGATGLYPVVLLTQFLLLAAWAFAESVADVRELFQGNSVPLWKTEGDWKTSLGGLVIPDNEIPGTDISLGISLSYRDYLKVFLLIKDTQELCLRSMDVIQQEIGSRERGFRLADCYGGAAATVNFSSPYRLITLPLVGEAMGSGHRLQVFSRYEYQ